MLGTQRINPTFDPKPVLDDIEKAVYDLLKPYGFRKHGRTLHRFVSEDISQIINFQLGQAYRGETHLLFVNVGIRVPECMERSFDAVSPLKKYYQEYECNLRSRLGEVEGNAASCYDLRTNTEAILADITRQIQTVVLPAFEVLSSRDSILRSRRNYPNFDKLNSHLILLEEAMIYGKQGDREKAEKTFWEYYHLSETAQLAQKDPKAIQNHLRYLDELAMKLGFLRG